MIFMATQAQIYMTAHCLKLPVSLCLSRNERNSCYILFTIQSAYQKLQQQKRYHFKSCSFTGSRNSETSKLPLNHRSDKETETEPERLADAENPENLQVFLKLNKIYFLWNWCEHAVKTYSSKSENFFLSQFKWSSSQLWYILNCYSFIFVCA